MVAMLPFQCLHNMRGRYCVWSSGACSTNRNSDYIIKLLVDGYIRPIPFTQVSGWIEESNDRWPHQSVTSRSRRGAGLGASLPLHHVPPHTTVPGYTVALLYCHSRPVHDVTHTVCLQAAMFRFPSNETLGWCATGRHGV